MRLLLQPEQKGQSMSMHGYAEKSQFRELIEMLYNAEANGANMYYVMAYLAREKGWDDVAEACCANAAEDAFHGGRYGAMLGKGDSDEDKFWKMLLGAYRLEAGAEAQLKAIIAKVRAAGENELADEIAKSIEEENEHARRLERVFDAHGISWKE
jgi:rubrerythrin